MRSIHWNEYKITPDQVYSENVYTSRMLDSSCQSVKWLLSLAYENKNAVTVDSHRRHFLPRVEIENYNVEIDGRNFYDQPINDLIRQNDEVRNVSTGQGDD